MLDSLEAVPFEFTPSEIQELLSLIELPETTNSSSEGSNRSAIKVDDEKKSRRKISNRESAKRSRWRKKRHLEDLTIQVNQLKTENQELMNRLSSTLDQCHVLWRDNDRLISESFVLRSRLMNLFKFPASRPSCL